LVSNNSHIVKMVNQTLDDTRKAEKNELFKGHRSTFL